ncbi:hypothetical protein ACFE04_011874 [Oxalis oulophora]
MGNCLFGNFGDSESEEAMIKVINNNGGIMEFSPPITAGFITNEFPGYAIFPSHDLFWKPLFDDENLLPGKSYHLLPLNHLQQHLIRPAASDDGGHTRSSSSSSSSLVTAAYRMSFDYHPQGEGVLKRSYIQVFSSRFMNKSGIRKKGYWKVKLVISPEQLLEILSQENRTEELIESVRTVAKCGGSSMSPSMVFSDQWSLSSSSRNNSTKKDNILLDF